MKRFLLAFGVSVLLLGCSSAVKLDDVPVEDKTGQAISPGGAGAGGAGQGSGSGAGGVGQSNVAKIDLGKTAQDAAAPAGARVIYFDYDSFAIKPEFQSIIESQARFIKADKNRKMAIEGHTDERGGREYNLALGQKRSEAVRRALGLLGVNDAQVEAVSFGKEKPAVPGSSEEAMAKNRRAEIAYR
jgi:peptidoglycan-associated lipoprotein